ncbi:MAG: hypothetical protein NVS9B15_07790 [Acidobacteriaceae bacterium]
MRKLSQLAGLFFCALAASAQVTISTPTNNATIGAPAQFVAKAVSSNGSPVTAMQIYVDNNSVFTTSASSLNTPLSLTAGGHNVVVQAWDATGAVYKSQIAVTVGIAPPPATPGVVVTAPSNGASVSAPTQVTAAATPSAGAAITATQVYVDNVLAWSGTSNVISASLSMAQGSHSLVVQAWDSKGQIFKTPVAVTVSGGGGEGGGGGGGVIPANAQLFDNIDQMTGWQSCSACAGAGGSGPVTPFSQTQFQATPSLDGQSSQFWLGGTSKVPYADALWWKQLGPQPNAMNFVYDLYFYAQTPQYAQAMEFDVNQSVNGKKYTFGTQCNIRGGAQWDVWDGATWQHTGITCNMPSAYTWHHVVLEFQRTSANQAKFIAVTLDGTRNYINRTYNPIAVNAAELNTAFQIDGDYAQHNYSVWVDKMKLYYW